MGNPTERETAPEPSSMPTQPDLVPPAAATRATPKEAEDTTPYEPPVRAYEQRVVGTVTTPSGPPAGEPTQALPTVTAPRPAHAPVRVSAVGGGVAPGGGAAPGGGVPPSGTPLGRPGGSSTPLGRPVGGSAQPSPGTALGTVSVPAGGDQPPSGGSLGTVLGGLSGDGAPSRLPKVAAWAAAGIVVLGGLFAGAQALVSDKVPQGTTVAGVEIGGMTAESAVAALEDGLRPRAAEPIPITAGEASTNLDPAKAGLALDAEATVSDLTGFSLSPVRLWEHLVGAEEVPPQVDVDPRKLDAAIGRLQERLLVTPKNGTVKLVDGAAVATPAKDGTEVVPEEAAEVITSGWLVDGGPFELPTRFVEPKIDQAETDAALAEAEKLVSGPVQVSVGGQRIELPPEALAEVASYKPAQGELNLKLDGEKLVQAVVDRTSDLLTEPVDARFEFSGGKPVIVGGEPGTALKTRDVVAAVRKAATGEERSAELQLVEKEPEDTRQELQELGVKEVISSFSTPLTPEPIRTQNLIRGAELLTGTLIKPDETFSLVEALSPITIENGYHAAGVVNNGVHTEGVGGGLSQMATTTYNAGYFAGFDDVEHRQHSYWFTRYPAGREATIYVDSLDMKFHNDTPYGAVMQSWVSGGELHVAIWSTEYYKVRTSESNWSNVVPTTTEHRSGPDCELYPAGQPGFSITNYRKVYLDGKLVKDESYPWTYKPDNGVVCDPPPGGGGKQGDG